MAVIPRTKAVSADTFIGAAPDAAAAAVVTTADTRTIRKVGKKHIITVSIDPTVLADLDAYALGMGMSRAAVMTYAVKQLLKDE
ncbi:hypothetical protein [Burkholderia pseudomallei]|uniref:hypothetical protein n=1 Tax=Burkholderia pseudomallei TaxID=28450 RepID=UPI000A1A212D|nr:hypothetical protein [Burkholderia pseudomallei]ARL97320.1 hypothetical protein BOC58_32050 [Burkholderia pseudomallei]